jgi:hypothetical protein
MQSSSAMSWVNVLHFFEMFISKLQKLHVIKKTQNQLIDSTFPSSFHRGFRLKWRMKIVRN